MTARPGRSKRLHRSAAGAGRIDHKLAPRRDAVAHRGDLGRRHIRPDEIELVFDAVERTVADQDQHEIVVSLGVARHRFKRFASTGPPWPARRSTYTTCAELPRDLEDASRSFAAAVNRCS